MTIFYTIGHSNRSAQDFIEVVRQAPVTLVVDVRTIPKSRHNPQFNEETLKQTLATVGISYRRQAQLGGLRGKSLEKNAENTFWENASFRNYADYTASLQFREGMAALRHFAQSNVCAIMCAEAVWWRCHRRIITDYLIAGGDTVIHILGQGKLEHASLTDAAIVHRDGTITYPAKQMEIPL